MKITHGCGAWWTGEGRAHCAGCHLTFSGETAWARHRKNFECRSPVDVGLEPRDKPYGVLWGFPGTWSPTEDDEC